MNSLVGKRMAKSQQMRWSVRGAHMLMQVRTADINGELRDRLRAEFRKPDPPSLRRSVPSRRSSTRRDPREVTGLDEFAKACLSKPGLSSMLYDPFLRGFPVLPRTTSVTGLIDR